MPTNFWGCCPKKMLSPHILAFNRHFISPAMSFVCEYCKKPYASRRGLSQHQEQNQRCQALFQGANRAKSFVVDSSFLRCVAIQEAPKAKNLSHRTRGLGPLQSNNAGERLVEGSQSSQNEANSLYSDDDMGFQLGDSDQETDTEGEISPKSPDTTMRDNFKEYCSKADSFVDFPKIWVDALNLMHKLRATKASLDTYETIMEWHLKASKKLHPHEALGNSQHYLSRKSVFQFLEKRYNMHKNYNQVARIVLPSSKASVNVVCTDVKMAIQSLLTDPRIRANDYLFHGNDPFAAPQESNFVGDLNTGKAYIATYKRLITKPNQILFPILVYIDGANTGQFAELPITAVKIAAGIHTRLARDKPWMWRTIGYIPHVKKDRSRGLRLFIESGHLDATRAIYEAEENEGQVTGKEAKKAQDLHTMLAKVFEGLVELQENGGFIWDLSYNGRVYKDVEFIPFIPFVKCDTDEADKLCGSFTCRTGNVAQLCR